MVESYEEVCVFLFCLLVCHSRPDGLGERTAVLAAAWSFSSLRPVMYTFAPLLSRAWARVSPRPEPPMMVSFLAIGLCVVSAG